MLNPLKRGGQPAVLRIDVLQAGRQHMALAAAEEVAVRQVDTDQPDAARTRRFAVAAAGGLLFLTSDALLATNRFHTPLPLS